MSSAERLGSVSLPSPGAKAAFSGGWTSWVGGQSHEQFRLEQVVWGLVGSGVAV